jgi:YVTN family beta-propeller protein
MRKRFATALGVVISLAAVLLLDGCAAPADPDPTSMPQFAVSQRAALGGAGGWDFISFDSARQRLFISRGDRVQVWSASTGQVTGEIAQTEGVHGIALAPELGRGFTSNGRSNTVTAFALEDLTVLAKVPVPGGNPDAILYEPVFKRVYVFNGRSHDVSILDAMTLRVIRTIPLGGKPEVGVSDDTGTISKTHPKSSRSTRKPTAFRHGGASPPARSQPALRLTRHIHASFRCARTSAWRSSIPGRDGSSLRFQLTPSLTGRHSIRRLESRGAPTVRAP